MKLYCKDCGHLWEAENTLNHLCENCYSINIGEQHPKDPRNTPKPSDPRLN